MKTAEGYFEEYFGTKPELPYSLDAVEFAKYYAQQNTLNRDKVMEILVKLLKYYGGIIIDDDELINSVDAICSLSLPNLNEEEIETIAKKVADENGGGLWGDYYRAAKAAIKELTKLKKEER